MRVLGHSQTSLTLGTRSHVVPERRRRGRRLPRRVLLPHQLAAPYDSCLPASFSAGDVGPQGRGPLLGNGSRKGRGRVL